MFGGSLKPLAAPAFAFFMRAVPEENELLTLTEEDVRALSSDTFGLPIFRDTQDAGPAIRIAKSPALISFRDSSLAKYVNLYHMAGDSSEFFTLDNASFIGGLPGQ